MRKNPKDARSPYLVVADDLREAITHGRYQPGEKIPSISQLADEYDVVASTVQAALRLLKTEGLLEGRQGAGTFVTQIGGKSGLIDALLQALDRNDPLFTYSGPITPHDRAVLQTALDPRS